MRILIPTDDDFNFEQCKNLYNKIAEFMGNNCKFEDLVCKTHFYSFYDNEIFVGCIYVTGEDEKLFLNGFSVRKNHKFNIEAVKKLSSFYNCPLYAKTKNRTAEILLKKCGYKLLFVNSDGVKYLKKEK